MADVLETTPQGDASNVTPEDGMAFLRSLINQASQPQQTEQTPEPAPTQPVEPAPAEPTEPEQPTEPTPAPAQQGIDAGQYADLQAKYTQMSNMFEKMAKANNIEYTDTDDLLAKFNDDAIGKLAAQQGVPKELLQRMESLEHDAQMYRAQQNQNRLVTAMQGVQSEFGLNEQELMDFATELDNAKVDLSTVNIRAEYLNRNMDKIIERRVQAAVEAALRQDAANAAQATTPMGAGASTGTQSGISVDSPDSLRALLFSNR